MEVLNKVTRKLQIKFSIQLWPLTLRENVLKLADKDKRVLVMVKCMAVPE